VADEARARLVLVHGFTQTGRSWDAVVAHLAGADRLDVVRVELPGHGAASDRRLGFVEAARSIGDEGGAGTYVGYSMGGRLCLRLALDRPDLVRSLVLVGASPGLPTEAERADRRRSDAPQAADHEAAGTKDFLDRWLAQPLFETTTPSPDELAARRTNSPAGLAYALRTLGTGAQDSLWDRLGELVMPVLLVAGEKDAKFRAIAERMAAAIGPAASTAWVEGAGHAVLLDQPEALARLIADAAAHAATR
jgi:2-succinyl-6-hydroxy-2,4-cyclohexadiene-1-carboxylate synthase